MVHTETEKNLFGEDLPHLTSPHPSTMLCFSSYRANRDRFQWERLEQCSQRYFDSENGVLRNVHWWVATPSCSRFTPMCLCHQAAFWYLPWGGDVLRRRSGVAVAMCHRPSGLSTYRLKGQCAGDEHPHLRSTGVWSPFTFMVHVRYRKNNG